jgi:uncharacterized membrane-anchored protein
LNERTKVALSKVPEATLIFWIVKIAATTLGETGGDSVTMTLDWGYLSRVAIFLPILGLLVIWQIGEISSVSVLGDHRRIHHLRDNVGRFR